MIDVDVTDELRINDHGIIVTVAASDVLQCMRKYNGLPLLRPVSGNKSCPNPDCRGGWAPDLLSSGELRCPVCLTTWKV